MASKRRTLKTTKDVALIEENIYIFVPLLSIETVYVVTSRNNVEGRYFNNLSAATKEFTAEVEQSEAEDTKLSGESDFLIGYDFMSSHLN